MFLWASGVVGCRMALNNVASVGGQDEDDIVTIMLAKIKKMEQKNVKEEFGYTEGLIRVVEEIRMIKERFKGLEQGLVGSMETLEKERTDLCVDLRQEGVEDDENEQDNEGEMKVVWMEVGIGEMEQELSCFKGNNDRLGQEQELCIDEKDKLDDERGKTW